MSNPLLPGMTHFISLAQAKEMTKRYRDNMENILAPEYKGQGILSICETFNREAFDALLAEKECVALRIYFGMYPDLKIKVIAVGVDADNKDILPSQDQGTVGDDIDKPIVEDGRPCPDFCPQPPL